MEADFRVVLRVPIKQPTPTKADKDEAARRTLDDPVYHDKDEVWRTEEIARHLSEITSAATGLAAEDELKDLEKKLAKFGEVVSITIDEVRTA